VATTDGVGGGHPGNHDIEGGHPAAALDVGMVMGRVEKTPTQDKTRDLELNSYPQTLTGIKLKPGRNPTGLTTSSKKTLIEKS
jgi:hypothetical protein